MALNHSREQQPLTYRMQFPDKPPESGMARLPPHSPRQVVTTVAANETKPEPPPEESPPTMKRQSTRPPPPAPEPAPESQPSPSKKLVRGAAVDKKIKAAALAAMALPGAVQKDVAARFGLSQSTISHWLARAGARKKPRQLELTEKSKKALEPSSTRPLARLDAICDRLQASIEESTQALREVDELRTALRQLFGG
jgi:transposase-like protein